jgi:hypothetical protein
MLVVKPMVNKVPLRPHRHPKLPLLVPVTYLQHVGSHRGPFMLSKKVFKPTVVRGGRWVRTTRPSWLSRRSDKASSAGRITDTRSCSVAGLGKGSVWWSGGRMKEGQLTLYNSVFI